MEATLQGRIDSVVARYKPLFDALSAEAEIMQQDFEEPSKVGAVLKVDIDVSWESTELKFDVPTVRMKRVDASFDLPEVHMNRRRIVFDTPSVRMVTKTVGKYPCFKGWKWYSCDLKMDVPEVFMERQEIKLDIPEVRTKRHEIKFDIPEFYMHRLNWSLHLPQFKIINIKAETEAMERRGKDLRSRSEALSQAMTQEIDSLMAGGFGEGAQSAAAKREEIAAPFNNAIQTIAQTIDDLTSKKIDPIKVPADDGNINLRKALEELIVERDKCLAEYDASVAPSEESYRPEHTH